MRKSLQDIKNLIVDISYPNTLPVELEPYYVYLKDAGHSILCVLKTHLNNARGQMDDYEIPIPVKYVLEKGYELQGDYVIVDAVYDSITGVDIDESYSEYSNDHVDHRLQVYTVGQKRPDYATGQDSVVFDINDSGVDLRVLFNRPAQREIDAYKAGEPFEMRMVTLHEIMFMLFKFGDNPWIDAPYNPHLSINLTQLQELPENFGYSMLVVLADSSSGEVKGLRNISIPHAFSEKIQIEIEKLLKKPFARQEYDNRINKIYISYSTKDLVKMSSEYFRI